VLNLSATLILPQNAPTVSSTTMAARFVLGTATLSTTTLLFEHYNSAVAPSYIGTKVQITAKCETVPQEITVVFQDGGNIDIPSGASVLIQGKTTFELEAPAPGNPPAPGFTVEGSFISNVGAGQVLEMHVNYTGPNGALSFLNNGAILMFSNVVTAGTVVAEAVTVTFQDSVVTFSEVIPPQNATALSALFVNVRSDQPSNLGSCGSIAPRNGWWLGGSCKFECKQAGC